MKKILFFLTVLLFFSSKVSSNISDTLNNCIDSGGNNYIKSFNSLKVEKIEVDINNYRKWAVNSIKIITGNFRFIPEKYKSRFKAKILVTYSDNIKCSLLGRVRHSGDAKDHIKLHGNSILQSLDIHLDEGNIKEITKFKLYKPDVRGVIEDEVLQNEILRSLGYIAPRSFKVEARVNQAHSIMLFQEKASKELLEFNNRREGPILEGDQKFFFKLVEDLPSNQLSHWSMNIPNLRGKAIKTMLAKQTNASIIRKNDVSKNISLEAISKLNLIYLYYGKRFQDEKNNFLYFDYDLDNTLLGLLDSENIVKLDIYNLLMQSTNSQHGMGPNQRKFYWNSIENYFEPIVYDASPLIEASSGYTTVNFRLPVSSHIEEAFKILETKLQKIDLSKIHKNINQTGVDLSSKDLDMKVKKILLNLKILKSHYEAFDETILEHNKYQYTKNILDKFNSSIKEINKNVLLIRNKKNTQEYKKCGSSLENCENILFSDNQLIDLFEGELILDQNVYQYLGNELDLNSIKEKSNYKKKQIENSYIYYENGIDLMVDADNSLIDIKQTVAGARIYIINGELKDLSIKFEGYKSNKADVFPKNYPFDIKGLTGCLTLVNLRVDNLSINANGSSCEDTVNLINVEGTLNDVNIVDSFSDGLDIDFSTVEINKINISSARNDCVDFSSGNYKVNEMNLLNCGDKALSVGEKSMLLVDKIFVENSNIGVASKDSSIVKLEYAYLKNLKTCLAAYNKKQEFYGGFINVENFDCKNYYQKTDIDNYSEIKSKDLILDKTKHESSYALKEYKIKSSKNYLKDYPAFNSDKSINVVIEIPSGQKEKWEVSKIDGSLVRDFYYGTPRAINYSPYPVNYGMIPRTVLPFSMGGDGDPLDVLVLGNSLKQGEVINAKIIGIMRMRDFGEGDHKIIAVPLNDKLAEFDNLLNLNNKHPELLQDIKVWFENYKGINAVKFVNLGTPREAKELVLKTNKYFNKNGVRPR